MFLKNSSVFKKLFLFSFFSLLIFAIAGAALAAAGDYVPLVPIPGIPAGASLTKYLSGLYNFVISVVGVLAMGVLIYGGMRYLTSAGNPAAVEDAKDAITSAIYGLILALASWLIINVVNPDILVLKNPGVGLPGGKYSYSATSNSCVASPLGDGTADNPCDCIDGVKVTATKKTANLTLNASPSSVVFGGTITATGKLTDASTGAGLGGKSIRLRVVNEDPLVNMWAESAAFTTNADGTFSYPVVENICTAPEKWQITFTGDATYADIGSNIVDVATTPPGGTPCDTTNYTNSPAAFLPVSGGTFCNKVCSDPSLASDTKQHCFVVKLGVGKTAEEASSGNQRIEIVPLKVGQPVYFDTISNTKSGLPIARIQVDTNPNIADWLFGITYDYDCVFDTACGGALGCPLGIYTSWDPPTDGKFVHTYSSATPDTYPLSLEVGIKNPDGTCSSKVDKNAIIKVQN